MIVVPAIVSLCSVGGLFQDVRAVAERLASVGIGAAGSLAANGSDTVGNASAASQSIKIKAAPSITSFSATPRTRLFIGGTSYQNQTAGESWSLSAPDDHTLRFEVRPGDHAWFDTGTVDRSQVASDPVISNGTAINIAYKFMLEPGPANTASWFVTAEMHNDDEALGPNMHTSPPFAIELAGEHLRAVVRYCPTGLDPSNRAGNLRMLTLWTDHSPVQRGQFYDIKVQANVDNAREGFLGVWVNGVEVVNYHGPLGYGAPTYWEEGLYRSADASQTVAASFRDLIITIGSQ